MADDSKGDALLQKLSELHALPFLIFAVLARSEAVVERQGSQVARSLGRVSRKSEAWQTVMIECDSHPLLRALFHLALMVTKRSGSRYYERIDEALEDALDPCFEDDELRELVDGLREACALVGDYADCHAALMTHLRDVAAEWDDHPGEDLERLRAEQRRDMLFLQRVLAP